MNGASCVVLVGLTLGASVTGCSQSSSPQTVTTTVSTPASGQVSGPVPRSQTPSMSTTAPALVPTVTSPLAPASTVIMIPSPNGDGSLVPCEGTICTNPNHGAGPDQDAPPEPGQPTFEGPGADAPPEPGQPALAGPGGSAGPPEPGQPTFAGSGADAPPEPGESTFSDGSAG